MTQTKRVAFRPLSRRGGEVWMDVIDPDLFAIYMRKQGLSTRKLALVCGCHQSMITHLMSGRRKSCTPDLAIDIAAALGVDLNALFLPKTSRVAAAS